MAFGVFLWFLSGLWLVLSGSLVVLDVHVVEKQVMCQIHVAHGAGVLDQLDMFERNEYPLQAASQCRSPWLTVYS